MDEHLDAWLSIGHRWKDFFSLTPHATSRSIARLVERQSDVAVTGAYQGEAFARTKRLKPLKAYLSKTKNAKPNMANIVAALGVSMDEIEKVRGEAGV